MVALDTPRRRAASLVDRRLFSIAEEVYVASRQKKGLRPVAVEAEDLANSKGLVFPGSSCHQKSRENRTSWAMGSVFPQVYASSFSPIYSPSRGMMVT
jgi:hypothetical protein